MKWIVSALVFAYLAFGGDAMAFKASRCAKVFPGESKGLGKVEKIWYVMFSVSTSTSQFLTSTGDCKMIGGISQEERKIFVAGNADQLRMDMVRAEGEYLSAAAFLYGCDGTAMNQVSLRLQENVTRIFGENLARSPSEVADGFHALMQSDSGLRRLCSLEADS